MRSICIFFCIASVAVAQSVPQPSPLPPLGPGPLLARAPAFAQWLVSTKESSVDNAAIPDQNTKYDERTLVTKTGDVRCEVSVNGDGTRTQKWCQGPYQAVFYPGVKDPQVMMSGGAELGGVGFTDFSKTDYPGFGWISRKNYTGVQTVEGVACIVFHEDPKGIDGAATPAPAASPAATGNAAPTLPQGGSTAYIAADSRQPVLLVADGVTSLYQFEPTPASPLTLPPSVAAAIQAVQANIEREQPHLAPP